MAVLPKGLGQETEPGHQQSRSPADEPTDAAGDVSLRPTSFEGALPTKSFAAAAYGVARRSSLPPPPDLKAIAAIPSPTPSWPSPEAKSLCTNFAAAAASTSPGLSRCLPTPPSSPTLKHRPEQFGVRSALGTYIGQLKLHQATQDSCNDVPSEFRSRLSSDVKVYESGATTSMAENSEGITLITPLCSCHCRECTLPKLKAKESTSSNGAAYSSSSCAKSPPSLLKIKPKDCRELAIGLSMCQSTDKDLMAHGCISSPDPVYEKIPYGSRYWELNKPPEHVKGINPLGFFSPHPVWEGFAAPVEREGKTDSFYCVSCNKVLYGRADSAVKHMVVRKVCRITPESKQDLLARVDAFNKRRNDLKRK